MAWGISRFWKLYRSHFRETVRLSIPITIGQLGFVMMGVVDNAMVGRVSAEALGAAFISNSVFFLVGVIGMGCMMAISPLVSIALAQGNKQGIRQILGSVTPANFIISTILLGIIWLFIWKFEWLRQTPEVTAMARRYLAIISISVYPLMAFMGLKSFWDAHEKTTIPMAITLIGVCLNALLNWLLIFGNLGFPRMELDGAAIATLITRLFMYLTLMIYTYRGKSMRPLALRWSRGLYHAHTIREIFRLGLPSGFQYFFEIGAFSGAAIMAGWLGSNELAAHGIAINLAAVTYMAASGFSAAGAIRAGYAFGLRDRKKVRLSGLAAVYLAFGFMGVSALFFLLSRNILPGLFTTDAQVATIAAQLLAIAALFQLSDGVQSVGLGITRGIKEVKLPTIITLIAYWIVGLPGAYLLGFNFQLGIAGMWYGLSLGLTISAFWLIFLFNQKTSAQNFKPLKINGLQ